ncbi:lipase 3-like [Culicoides brevitarsis]|uniref:lipase 3-like n=1 Tax=Culicoides brevitarsis TaxID=469753 RepID=UPI00307C5D57
MNKAVGYIFAIIFSIILIECRAKDALTENFIIAAGFPVETHHVTTEDGYILTLHRIPSTNRSSTPVLLAHPLSSSGLIWVLSLVPKLKPIAFSLSNKGHDVWILHHRGTTESFRHQTLKPSNQSFWNFTLHELGVFDIANSVDYIRHETGKNQINCIGMSQGSTTLLMLLASRQEFNRKISTVYLIAPVFECKYIPMSVKFIYGSDLMDFLLKIFDPDGKSYVALGDMNFTENVSLIASHEILMKILLESVSLGIGRFDQDLDYVRI